MKAVKFTETDCAAISTLLMEIAKFVLTRSSLDIPYDSDFNILGFVTSSNVDVYVVYKDGVVLNKNTNEVYSVQFNVEVKKKNVEGSNIQETNGGIMHRNIAMYSDRDYAFIDHCRHVPFVLYDIGEKWRKELFEVIAAVYAGKQQELVKE